MFRNVEVCWRGVILCDFWGCGVGNEVGSGEEWEAIGTMFVEVVERYFGGNVRFGGVLRVGFCKCVAICVQGVR